ncbi:MAG: winged helix-turn-helix domain-containing protein [Steroidobacteraceae bacterium]
MQPLNSRSLDALLMLVANAGQLVEKRRLMETVWPDSVVEDNNLNQCILSIRKALGETAGSNQYVMTEQGRGFRFVSPVRVVVRESSADAGERMPPGPFWTAAAAGLFMLSLVLLLVTLHERSATTASCTNNAIAARAGSPAR